MTPDLTSYIESYSPAADILVVAVCIVFIVLIRTAFINRTRSFSYLNHMIYFAITASVANLLYHFALSGRNSVSHMLVYVPRVVFHVSLYFLLWMMIQYLMETVKPDSGRIKRCFILSTVVLAVLSAAEIAQTIFRFGFYISDDHVVHMEAPIFVSGYVFYVIVMVVILIRYKEKIFRPILIGIIASVAISFLLMFIQQLIGESSYTVFTFLFPIYALLYLAHSNPYDIEIGAVDERAFNDFMKLSFEDDEELYLMSLFMHDYEGKGTRYPEEMQKMIKKFIFKYFKSPTLFMITGGHMILAVKTSLNPDHEKAAMDMYGEFLTLHEEFKIDYKVVFMKNDKRLAHENDYVNFISYLHFDMIENSILKPEDKHIDDYLRYKYIRSQLADIHNKYDLNDPRVLVYCQPVLNIKTGRYDTAESLMRLELPELGIVYPDEFIYIAERYKYIYTLTQIILNKTCLKIKELVDQGYYVQRISVNFSVYDIREENFCDTVERIIRDTGVPYDKVAIEITETQNERDFENIKKRINELKDSGIRFYLDDFGTGYSNFERIMELPFDIVKFDRSLVIASGSGNRYKSMVSNLAMMFDNGEYSVLYEGVETDEDEKRCLDMNAKYLQGFKYSKPIPIDKLTDYLQKDNGSAVSGS